MSNTQPHKITLTSPSDICVFGDVALINNLILARITPYNKEELIGDCVQLLKSISGTNYFDEAFKLALECERILDKDVVIKKIEYINLSSSQYINEHTERSICRLYVANKKQHLGEELLDLYKIDQSTPKTLIAFGTKNTNVINKLLKSDDYSVRLALSMNPVLNYDALSHLAKDDISLIRLNVIQHPNFTSEMAKLFINETSDLNILTLKERLNFPKDKHIINYLINNGNAAIKKIIGA
jgi:hypothetical protein